jgi:hypothetical protein
VKRSLSGPAEQAVAPYEGLATAQDGAAAGKAADQNQSSAT